MNATGANGSLGGGTELGRVGGIEEVFVAMDDGDGFVLICDASEDGDGIPEG